MTRHRFCCPEAAWDGDRVRIDGAAAAQIRRVLRLGPGDHVVLFGADEWEYTVRLESTEREAVCGTVVTRAAPRAEPRCALTLAVALLKGEKTEWVIQKGTELGVTRFVLMQTRRTVATPDERRAAGRQQRYARIAREATEQCGRLRPPCVDGVAPLERALEASAGMALTLHEGATERLGDLLREEAFGRSGRVPAERAGTHKVGGAFRRSGAGEIGPEHPNLLLLVGPEGGFTEEEVALAAGRGARPVSLGPRVLRAETAAIAAVALAMDVLDR